MTALTTLTTRVSTRAALISGAALLGGGLAVAPAAGAASPQAPAHPSAQTSAKTSALAGAERAAAPAGCPREYYCVYLHASYRGEDYFFKDDNPSWKRWAIFNNDSSSWNNGATGLGVALYGEENYGRKLGCLPRGQGWTQHRPNDDGESNKWMRC
ncbi:peptidase inhibitor family I36 protein [Streptomyces aureocirculatus]|uniref:peptidase inhibitor family I36 protein n=1 Tax=Streptomyces aureocirculatus TaxID=67275 RepID=UPI0004C48BE0|nr:peptidase inhibitor family I36 protein [Streptomyces aureocirculatus]